jgi:hypothetical protein
VELGLQERIVGWKEETGKRDDDKTHSLAEESI